jgi:hypothetical protein
MPITSPASRPSSLLPTGCTLLRSSSSPGGPAENILLLGVQLGTRACPAVVKTESNDRMPRVVPKTTIQVEWK